ncbi:MAG TPA: hypothetical protein VG714_06850 [Acidobacteriaceae bacterium]|nr:hypothetical protein [Acidobacteriaceae bacterium]
MFRKLSLLSILFAAPVFAQTTAPTWFTITSENVSVSVTLPAGTTYRLGNATSNCWAQVTVQAQTTINPLSMGVANQQFPFSDPCPNQVKEFDVLETPAAQTITVTNSTASPATIAMVVPSTNPTSFDPTAGSSHTLTFTNFSVAPGSTQNALMFAFVNQPANNANRIWEGTQMNLSIDGINLVCTYGQTYTDGVFTLSCTVPSTSGTSTLQAATTVTP